MAQQLCVIVYHESISMDFMLPEIRLSKYILYAGARLSGTSLGFEDIITALLI